MSSSPSTGPSSIGVHGDALLQSLRTGWKPLPNRTLFTMALGGLRVRMMRSIVTMVSVVLAIAFLSYTGLTSMLTYSLALAVEAYGQIKPAEPSSVQAAAKVAGALMPFKGMALEEQRRFAKILAMDNAETAEARLLTLPQLIEKAIVAAAEAQKAAERVEKDTNALKVDRDAAKSRAASADAELKKLQSERESRMLEVECAKWVRSGGQPSEQVLTRVAKDLQNRFETLVATTTTAGRFTKDELVQTDAMIELAGKTSPESSQSLREAMKSERTKRAEADLRTLLRQAGVNISQTLVGNPMDKWLITMAMLTCAIGIANAMLMSVTERFREIGTMKCLGAQDSLVIKLFLLESALLGGVGAVAGMVLGVIVAVVGAYLQYRSHGLEHFPVLGGWKVLLLAMAGGVILTVVGAAGPAWSASRMRPVDALRVDE